MFSSGRQENRRNVAANLQSFEDEAEAENIVYPMRPERIQSIRRWVSDVGREQSRRNVQSSQHMNSGVGAFPPKEFTASSQSDAMTVSSEDEEDIADRLDRAALLLNLENSNVHHTKPPSFTRSRPPRTGHTTQIRQGPRATVKSSVFQDAHGLGLGEGTSIHNVGGSVRVTHRQDGGTVRKSVIVNDGRNVTVINSVNGRPIGPREHDYDPFKTHHDASDFLQSTRPAERTFNYNPQPHYNQGPPNLNTLNALPKGLPPRHLRNGNYIIPRWG
ncbi:hypothetical protein K443DRAFT_681241 [Laccaria amethystina LaAM-08-1]|uniref:Uncharacterized protein n=1 Tax=Laccaria amethystina LaAM-08-1 TaxID=1095629 RepID=A0A0C9WYA3_9AGAR|nr:hypothetical protein K443DRAFT_681241 [Laccaria amethystina LaAM-08-1]